MLDALAAVGAPKLSQLVPRVCRPEPRTVRPTEDEARRCLSCGDLGLRWVVTCALDIGLRHKTAEALTPRHLESGLIVTATKRGRVVRLPVTPRLRLLVALARVQPGEEDCRFIDLLNNRRAVQGSNTIGERWVRWKLQAGLPPGLHIHDLRRDAAHRVYAACHDIREVQGLLGHERPITSLQYLHIAGAQVSGENINKSLIEEVA